MEDKKCLALAGNKIYIEPQGFCFPKMILLAEPKLYNWYYMNYMKPIVRMDNMNSLTFHIRDSIVYGSNTSVNSKIMRLSSINLNFCAQIQDMNEVIKAEISNGKYCIVFLDIYYLKYNKECYGKIHYLKEIMIYGYDNHLKRFNCFCYINDSYHSFELSYEEVRQAFDSARSRIESTNGWEEYICITMKRVGHTAEYPYINELFMSKLKAYIQGNLSDHIQHEELLYMNRNTNTACAFGINVTDVFLRYMEMIRSEIENDTIYDRFIDQITAFNLYWSFHAGLLERLEYYAGRNNLEDVLEKCVSDYKDKVISECKLVRMLYIKLMYLVKKHFQALKPTEQILGHLQQIKICEERILKEYINIVEKNME